MLSFLELQNYGNISVMVWIYMPFYVEQHKITIVRYATFITYWKVCFYGGCRHFYIILLIDRLLLV